MIRSFSLRKGPAIPVAPLGPVTPEPCIPMSDASVHVRVGPNLDIFPFDKKELTKVSGYFRRRLRRSNGPVDLPNEDAASFSMFEVWMNTRNSNLALQSGQFQEEPWRNNSARAWVLAQVLESRDFSRFCLECFIKNIEHIQTEPWQHIERNTQSRSPLRRLSNHWVSWISFGRNPEHVNAPLSMLQGVPRVYDNTVDPRAYNLDHWHSRCANRVAPTCVHLGSYRSIAQAPRHSRKVEWENYLSRTRRNKDVMYELTPCGAPVRGTLTVSS
jgi:hypothetical protein